MRVPLILTSENFTTEKLLDPHPFCRTLCDWIDCFFADTPYHNAMYAEAQVGVEELVGRPIFRSESEDLDDLANQYALTKHGLWDVWTRAIDRACESDAAGP